MEILDFLKLGFSTLKQNPEVRDVDYQRTVLRHSSKRRRSSLALLPQLNVGLSERKTLLRIVEMAVLSQMMSPRFLALKVDESRW